MSKLKKVVDLESMKAVFGEALIQNFRTVLLAHWKGESPYTYAEEQYRKGNKEFPNGDFEGFFELILEKCYSSLKLGGVRFEVVQAELEIRQPMPYETYVLDELIAEGVSDGFIGIIGVFRVGDGYMKLHSRQISKPFYQYVPRQTEYDAVV